ncbi:3-methyl-2-oxobutanoate hydroxymethyltransferase [Ethanoligenens harbinense]|uniref:3-methyl-2-oxobutanoate hydroxymethyltransferase n=1 Tax=Ethanoligenens harbinense (strain DSM 18485 / JCM 12961 / CGMCC 1.5033 / YUAN-3) TaxID=663278 RepID=E6U5I9_ETHHY|nr:3-methyl-2-oxobutanoate hydroxymethyltransferase [Ethanoligenens harbinense]ADU25656.1 3-methyl-2-oxobutanoate hydroxymethyltransferase [Ethanoligenens harbinense YUAN-3]AVQ97290.1 3-methyl-2-oxobutanoate hydroxymethyltransferase [Ethanoligenens harbinense YUAN-3]AYF39956.1 3-methyl-2-oxobutanoate hydroxymethyltransferase [Ethanoligenens harbinense]AYF42784.1 3-methyl-2-oxobutanoate hydroxymethyltransferase [Ethanoligenens harbinense]QCN93535.1 3-methyl-2-oxobutanoate hydroxymethyltransfera
MSRTVTTQSFLDAKQNRRKIAMLTAYDYAMAKIVDGSGIDAVLVGDSLGMVVQGHDSTLEVTMDDMAYHCACVARGLQHALLVCDMPFLSCHVGLEEAVRNAGRLVQQSKADAVKLEGGIGMADTVKAIVRAQIPVMGHIGLTPQSVRLIGGYKVQGKDEAKARGLIEDALALEDAGVFSIVLEAVPEGLAKIITEKVSVPTIGIGAGRYCDGQVLVVHDLLGMYDAFVPKFVKQYAHLGGLIAEAVSAYARDVREGRFPEQKHTFSAGESFLEKLY